MATVKLVLSQLTLNRCYAPTYECCQCPCSLRTDVSTTHIRQAKGFQLTVSIPAPNGLDTAYASSNSVMPNLLISVMLWDVKQSGMVPSCIRFLTSLRRCIRKSISRCLRDSGSRRNHWSERWNMGRSSVLHILERRKGRTGNFNSHGHDSTRYFPGILLPFGQYQSVCERKTGSLDTSTTSGLQHGEFPSGILY